MATRVLVVGRRAEMMAIARAQLEGGGYEVLSALDDVTAVATIERERPDALVLGGGVVGRERDALVAAYLATRADGVVLPVQGGPTRLLTQLMAVIPPQ